MRNKIVEIAKSQVGYHEGENNWTIYGEWYGMQDEWCNMFVSWCAYKAGISEDIIPKMACVPYTGKWFDDRGRYKNSRAWGGDYIPLPGDLILFDYEKDSSSDHIGIVEKVEGNTVYTIEGNSSNMVKENSYSLDNSTIRGYCVPNYEKQEQPKEDKTIRPTKKYKNNGNDRNVYADLWGHICIGSLNAGEVCECFGTWGDKAIVLYEIDGTDHNWKVGFVDNLENVM